MLKIGEGREGGGGAGIYPVESMGYNVCVPVPSHSNKPDKLSYL